jgi:hypothetical protein
VSHTSYVLLLYWYVLFVFACKRLYLHVLISIVIVLIQCFFLSFQCMPIHTNTCHYKQIHANTNGYKTWVEIRAQYFQYCIDCINMYFFSKYKHNTQQKQIQGQYRPNTIITKSKPVVGNPCVFVCICMFFACICMYLHVSACIGGGLPTTGSLPCCIACIACIGMYLYVFWMYLYVFCLYIQAL